MIRKALGTLIRRTAVTATTKRTIGRFAVRMSTTIGPAKRAMRIVAIGARIRKTRASGSTTFPSGVRLRRLRATAAVMRRPRSTLRAGRSLVDSAHDRVEAGHDGHRVGDEMTRHQHPDRLEVDERGVVDAEAERLIRAVADGIRGVL